MNYKHLFHAGSFSDVLKHSVQIMLIKALQMKEKPFCYIDTHAGNGMYNLTSEAAQKTQEYTAGIMRLWRNRTTISDPILKEYLELVASCQPSHCDAIQNYPGSPWFARQLCRENDRLVVCELHPEVYQELKQLFYHDKKVAVHHRNSYEGLKAFLPPKEQRGLVLIDPPYEKPGEFNDLIDLLAIADHRWPRGLYAIWYPLTDINKVNQFKNKLLAFSFKEILELEWFLYPHDFPAGLKASGMIMINPPWQIEKMIRPTLDELNAQLAVYPGSAYRLDWLKKDSASQ